MNPLPPSTLYRAGKALNLPTNDLNLEVVALLFGQEKDLQKAYKRLLLASRIIEVGKASGLHIDEALELIRKNGRK